MIVDRDGGIVKANPTFLDLAQVGVESAALGQNLARWLSHPGEDFPRHRGPSAAPRQRADVAAAASRAISAR